MACSNCGACCTFFEIRVPDKSNLPLVVVNEFDFPMKVWKKAGEVCSYLNYNSEKNKFYCNIHSDDNRPIACQRFSCDSLSFHEKSQLERCARELLSNYSSR